MRYDIHLSIDYSYQAASDHVRNILRLQPASGPRQRVTVSLLTIEPTPDERRDGVDFFGNPTTTVAWHRPIDQITFRLRALAERLAQGDEVDLSPALPELGADLALQTDLGPGSPQHFLAPSPRIGTDPAITAFTRAAISGTATTRGAVEALGRAIHAAMTYDADATDAMTPPEVAFADRHGVCQDFAQIMIAGLRAMGIPASYVSGFLRTLPPAGQPRLEGVDAMHAWVGAWCGAAHGWVEYDPTNAQWAAEDYITVAVGRDYLDAAPVRGAIRTAGGQESRQAVDVIPMD
jgi:transglutaminase-like putative cysteine protease